MPVDRIEAVLDAIGHLNGMSNPESEAYQIRNPLLQKSFARPGKHLVDDKGRRVFDSLLAGYKAGTYDIKLKISGLSRAGLKPTDTITNLLGCYGMKELLATKKVVNFLQKALSDPTINAHTPLNYFLDGSELPDSGQEG